MMRAYHKLAFDVGAGPSDRVVLCALKGLHKCCTETLRRSVRLHTAAISTEPVVVSQQTGRPLTMGTRVLRREGL
jgi:hypothetical protein